MPTKTPQEIWETALGEIQVQVSKPNFRTWFSKTSGLSYKDNQFVIGVPNTFAAEYLEKQFEPEFSRFDLVNLDNFTLITKLMIDNKVSSPFKMQTIRPQEGNHALIEPIKKLSRLKYGRPKEIVEAEIAQRSHLA